MKFLALLFVLMLEAKANTCAGDIKKFCAAVKPGEGQLSKCLHDNMNKLSRECAADLKTAASGKAKNPCHDNLVELCSDMPLQGEKLSYCLLKNENKLDRQCVDDFKKLKTKFVANNPCAPEVVEYCYGDIKASNTIISRCLLKNRSKASKACSASLDGMVASLKKKNSCYDDMNKHCPKETKPSLIQLCLEKNLGSLAPQCKMMVEKKALKAKNHPCHKDLNFLCKTALTAANKQTCLKTYESKLSPACRAHQQEKTKKIHTMVEACESDRLKLCSFIPKKAGPIIRCLKLNKDKLSARCKQAL